MYLYQHRHELQYLEEVGNYGTFCIEVYAKDNGHWKKIKEVSDVSTDIDIVLNLISICNIEQLDPIHLINVIEDFIG
ncbi:DUF6514 family protein [Massiliimalia massiliensis]|uniref:DUF6514 family protein n=1 Tax=Massiliimalia massiliensis TaxID=1852384 RepID=UPI000987B3F8|nr:DUF6514 family protein [Massiliimalia massiliensis]